MCKADLAITHMCEHVAQLRQLEAAAKAASESQAEATAVQEAMSSEAKRAQASLFLNDASSRSHCLLQKYSV